MSILDTVAGIVPLLVTWMYESPAAGVEVAHLPASVFPPRLCESCASSICSFDVSEVVTVLCVDDCVVLCAAVDVEGPLEEVDIVEVEDAVVFGLAEDDERRLDAVAPLELTCPGEMAPLK